MLQARALIPYLLVTVFHLTCLAVGADTAADVSQVVLMPMLALGLIWLLPPAARDTQLTRLTHWGLLFSWLGDSVPRLLHGDAAFGAMVGFFLVAQGCYIAAFRPWSGRSVLHHRPTLAVYVAAVVLLALVVPHAGVLAPVVIVYGLVLAAMGVAATGLNRLTWIGGAIFMASDSLIALDAFDVWTQPGHDVWVMLTYCAAQLFLVLGVVRISSDHDDQQHPGIPSSAGPRLAR